MTNFPQFDARQGIIMPGVYVLASDYDALEAENERLDALQYVSGYLRCPKCQFGGSYSILNATTGQIHARDVSGRHVCPNDGADLGRVTTKEWMKDDQTAYLKLCDLRDELQTQVARLTTERDEALHRGRLEGAEAALIDCGRRLVCRICDGDGYRAPKPGCANCQQLVRVVKDEAAQIVVQLEKA